MEFEEVFTEDEKLRIAKEFVRLKNTVYLDSAGALLYAESQIKQISHVLQSDFFCNPHTSKTTERIIDQVRFKILNLFNADPEEYSVIFTSGTTASLKLVAESFNFSPEDAFCYLTDSHMSVLGQREVVGTKNIIPITREKFFDPNFTLSTSGLVTFTAQCNFNGAKFPLQNIAKFQQNPDLFVMLDAASFLSSNFLDLKVFNPDYICLSFYKIFGYPTGLGALIVSKRGENRLVKKYYGGGTVKIALTRSNWHKNRDSLHERFEDGTIPFLSIIELETSFNFMEELLGKNFIQKISHHVFNLAKYLRNQLKSLKHFNDEPVVEFYHEFDFTDITKQGGILNFNLKHADKSFIGYAEFSQIAALNNIILRTGCFCNPGSCQTFLKLTNNELMKQFHAGHICGDENDLIEGQPTGSIRVSVGYMTTKENVDKLVDVVRSCYVETAEKIQKAKETSEGLKLKPRLKSIRIFPIKSCAPMVIEESWPITKKGLKFDREWLIIGQNGMSLTQKNSTLMCLISPVVDKSRNLLTLNFPNKSSVEISLEVEKLIPRDGRICETKVCGDRIQGWDCGDEVAAWLCDVLGIEGLRLIRQSEDVKRKNGLISLSNQAQFLLISEPSVKWLMKQVDDWEGSEQPTNNIVNRFRGNLIIENLEPLAETEFKAFKVGKVEFDVEGPCTRCQMICIDQESGEKTTEPLRTIGKVFKGKMRFGIYLKQKNFVDEVKLNCGDELEF